MYLYRWKKQLRTFEKILKRVLLILTPSPTLMVHAQLEVRFLSRSWGTPCFL